MRARGGEPCQGQASWRQWKSVAVEAERLGCGGATCVRGRGVLDKSVCCPLPSRLRVRPRNCILDDSRAAKHRNTWGARIRTSLTITWGINRRSAIRFVVVPTFPITPPSYRAQIWPSELQGRLKEHVHNSKDASSCQSSRVGWSCDT